MVTALLADDEEIVRSSMERWINWNALGIKLIGSVSDGEEAYRMIIQERPDIVLTDIRMPKVDGLELIRRTKSKIKNIFFAILSGYGEFGYAQEAMRYGVKHYLVKPATKEKLEETLKELKAEVEEARIEEQGVFSSLNERYQFSLQKSMLTELVSSPIDVDEILSSWNVLSPFENSDRCVMVAFKALDARKLVANAVPRILESRIKMPIYPLSAGSTIYLILTLPTKDHIEYVKEAVGAEHGIFTATQSGKLANLLREFAQAVRSVPEAAIYDAKGARYPLKSVSSSSEWEESLARRYRAVLNSAQDATLMDDLENTFFNMDLENAAALFVRMAFRDTDSAVLFHELGKVGDAEDLMALARSFPEHKVPRTKELFPVETVRKYVNDNFSNPDISLKWLSENVVYMNSEHLSRLFQKEMGQRFSDYLNVLRVNEARKLMAIYSKSTISDIAERVGYSNTGYFFHVFRRYVGMTPGEYIESIKEKGNGGES